MSWLRQRRRSTLSAESAPHLARKAEEPRVKTLLVRQSRSLFVVVVSWLALALYISFPPHGEFHHSSSTSANTPASGALHLLIPATERNPNLCKAVLSASIAGYPSPSIINWGKEFQNADKVDGGAHLGKISGVNDYLSSLDSIHDEDLVIVLDGYDTWLQLRPKTLLDRYYAINQRADARRADRIGLASPHGMRQEIVFGSQKRCWPWSEKDSACYAVPESDLPVHVYGPDTDVLLDDSQPNPYIRMRPRYLNAGFAIGPVRAMRKLFAHAAALIESESNFGSDQYIFSHIYGDQEVWREVVRRRTQGWISRTLARWRGGAASHWPVPTADDLLAVERKAREQDDGSYEFGIGLDFRSELSFSTVFAEDETAWLTSSTLSPAAVIEQTYTPSSNAAALGPMLNFTHFASPPADVAAALPPFWTFSHEPALPRWRAWRDVPLFTDLWTGAVPAAIHHNAHRDDRKALRAAWWNETWFFPHLRTLYDTTIFAPIIPLAVTSGHRRESGGNEVGEQQKQQLTEWWPLERYRGGVRDGLPWGQWLPYDAICHEFHEEVFRDGKGRWLLPEDN